MDLQLSTDAFDLALPTPRTGWWSLPPDEWLNSLTHLLGLLLALPGAAFLVGQAVRGGDALKLVSFGVFGLSMIALYAASTLFHSARGPAKERWAKADHSAIYLLIAGTYTPFALVTLRGPLGWGLFAFVWTLAALASPRSSGGTAAPCPPSPSTC
jgi:hemolysin III